MYHPLLSRRAVLALDSNLGQHVVPGVSREWMGGIADVSRLGEGAVLPICLGSQKSADRRGVECGVLSSALVQTRSIKKKFKKFL
jgi:hypothetical protein